MKIGITYLYTICRFGYPPSFEGDLEALKLIHDMGFHYLEMEGLGTEHAQRVWDHRKEFKENLDRYNIHVHNFCVVDPELTSLDDKCRHAAYDRFKRTMQIGVELGAETIHLASYAPPVQYVGKRPYQLDGEYELKDTFSLRVPDGFKWQKVWDTVVESSRFAAEEAAKYGKIVLMEPRTGEVICSVDSMIRLIQDVAMPNFKANFDVGHFAAQRENAVLALYKLEDMFANIHIADNDPKSADHILLGQGTVDWEEFFLTLKKMNYQGYLGLDLSASDTLAEDLIRSAKFIQDICGKLQIPVEM